MDKNDHKTFSISDYDVIGFDLDVCLAKYKWNEFFELIYSYFVAFLTKEKKYDSKLFKSYDQAWKDIIFRGLVIDTKRGNLLKVMGDGSIKRAYHGTTAMTSAEIENHYAGSKVPVINKIIKTFNHVEEYHLVDNTFEGAHVLAFSQLVDAATAKTLDGLSFQGCWDAIWEAYMDFLKPELSDLSGNFLYMGINAAKFCEPCSPELRAWLKKLKTQQTTIFLMTSSYAAFSTGVLKQIFGPDYKDYFDFFIGHAQKPVFFYADREFINVGNPDVGVTKLESKCWYETGSLKAFIPLLRDYTGRPNPKVLYFGDGLKNDIAPSKLYADWGAVAVFESMEVEMSARDQTNARDSPSKKQKSLKVVDASEEIYLGNNPVWGHFFEEDGKETLFAHVIREYADICVPWLDYIAELPVDHRFPTFDKMSGGTGYYPTLKTSPS